MANLSVAFAVNQVLSQLHEWQADSPIRTASVPSWCWHRPFDMMHDHSGGGNVSRRVFFRGARHPTELDPMQKVFDNLSDVRIVLDHINAAVFEIIDCQVPLLSAAQ